MSGTSGLPRAFMNLFRTLNGNLLVLILISLTSTSYGSSLGERDFRQLSSQGIESLVSHPDPTKHLNHADPDSHLSKILIPRVSGSENNTNVRNYIISTLKAMQWHIEEDEFTDHTPIGDLKFVNVVATKDPKASRRVVVAAHFDSKYFRNYPDNQFVGAIDSAMSCAMMLDLAEILNPLLEARHRRLELGEEPDEDVADTTLQLIFFDGEEAFVQWTDTDSIYGARHLAEKWASTYIVPHSKRRLFGPQATEISGIEHFILLDLLGAQNPTIKSYFSDTAWLFDKIASTEKRLGDSGHFVFGNQGQNMGPGRWRTYFTPRMGPPINLGYMGDDHVPFLRRGVSVLHLIPEPFPPVWHTIRDDASALDMPTMRRWNILLRVFLSEYLNLRPEDANARREEDILQRSQSELVR